MGRSSHSAKKRQREADKARKKREKAERRRRTRDGLEGGIPIATVEEVQVAAMATPIGVVTAEGAAQGGGARPSGPPSRLFVGGLSWDTSAEKLRGLFETCGDVTDAAIVKDRDTGESRGFGFVTMADRKAAQKAVKELDGEDLDGRTIRVNVATERGPR